MALRRLILTAGLALLMALPFSCALGERRALLIGCDSFLTQADTSPASSRNVALMAEALAGGTEPPVRLITRREGVGSVAELDALIQEAFQGAAEGDVNLLFLSTHGLWQSGTPAEGTVLLLSDGAREEALNAERLRALLAPVPGTKVLLVDACHSGAMIGKGTGEQLRNVFQGPEWQVMTACGGAEESWFWSSEVDRVRVGAGSFSGALSRGISSSGNWAADANRDGEITLTETKRWLLEQYGESTVQTYPEESDFVLMRYDTASVEKSRRYALENIAFQDNVLDAWQPSLRFSFNVLRASRVLYRLAVWNGNGWDFAGASLTDDAALTGIQGYLEPGYQQRALSLSGEAEGYVLMQFVSMAEGETTIAGSRVLCLPGADSDPQLLLEMPSVLPRGEELNMLVRHSCPCELTVIIRDAEGRQVRRLCSRQGSRPQQLPGTALCWSGCLADGTPAPAGDYTVQVTAWVGEQRSRAEARFTIE